jgi:hypothetical protein
MPALRVPCPPHTGHPHAESRIKALSIAFPHSIDVEERVELRRAAQQISGPAAGATASVF